MFGFLSGLSSKVYLAICAVLLGVLLSLGIYTYFLNSKLEDTQKSLTQKKLLYDILVEDLEDVSNIIAQREQEFEKFKNKKPEVKYKTIIKYKEKIKGGTCEEKVKAISDINFSDL